MLIHVTRPSWVHLEGSIWGLLANNMH